jgi:transposase-like protein
MANPRSSLLRVINVDQNRALPGRAVDKAGKTVDFQLSRKRDENAAKAFLRKAMKGQRTP